MEQVASGSGPLLANYQLRLPTYEGPLDVLLRLIERSQLDIEDVSLVAVTAQFFAFVDSLESAPPPVIAEFATVGARLTVLKSRSLLPKPVADEDEPEQSDLTYQLREYKRIKDIAGRLGQLHAAGNVVFGPALDGAIRRPGAGKPTRLANHDASLLVKSLRRRLSIIPRAPRVIKQRRVVSLREMVARIAERVAQSRSVPFSQVVCTYRTRTEVSTAFLAVLVLVRRESIAAAQGDLFGDIALSRGMASAQGHRPPSDDEFLN